MGHDEQAWNDEYVSVWTGPEKPETDYPEKAEAAKTEEPEQLEQVGPRYKDGDRVRVLCTHNKRKRDAYYGQVGVVNGFVDEGTFWVYVSNATSGEYKMEYFLENELEFVGQES